MSNKLLTIREFDTILPNVNFEDKEAGIHYLEAKYFKELDDFIKNQTETDEDGNPLEVLKGQTIKGKGYAIKARNHVGLIQLESGYQIQILPKIDLVFEDENERKTEHIFIDMLKTMKDFPGKIFSSAHLKTESMSLYEIFINLYVTQVSQLTRKGLKSAYIPREDNLNVFKGKLLLNQHLKKNIGHAERFYVQYDEYQLNRPENKLIKSTLLKLQKISTSSNNVKAIRQQLVYFELIDASKNYESDFSKVTIDRMTKEYEDILAWSKVFLLNKSFSTFSGDSKASALLFPMEKIFETFVSLYIENIFRTHRYEVSCQDRVHYLLSEGKRKIFALRPDIVLTNENGQKTIIDLKWKRLMDKPEKNYGISQADMYQMFAYSKKYKAENVWVLYPMVNELKDRMIQFQEEETNISIYFVDVANIENSLFTLLEKINVAREIDEWNKDTFESEKR